LRTRHHRTCSGLTVSALATISNTLVLLLKVIASAWTKLVKRAPAEDAASKANLRMTFSLLVPSGAVRIVERNDGILRKNSSFQVHVGGVGVGLKSHNLMASFS
jgi:hypothetical protein